VKGLQALLVRLRRRVVEGSGRIVQVPQQRDHELQESATIEEIRVESCTETRKHASTTQNVCLTPLLSQGLCRIVSAVLLYFFSRRGEEEWSTREVGASSGVL
jgi:hypothetical protein